MYCTDVDAQDEELAAFRGNALHFGIVFIALSTSPRLPDELVTSRDYSISPQVVHGLVRRKVEND